MPDDLVASGGFSTPAPLYDMFPFDLFPLTSVQLPTFSVPRGGIHFNDLSLKLSPKDQRFLDMAAGVALTSACKFRHGAVLVKHGKILAASPNLFKNDPKNCPPEFCSIHAEMAVMRKAVFPKKATIYVARVNKGGENRLSKPCPTCWAVLEQFKCKVIWSS